MLKFLVRKLFNAIPADSPLILKFAQRYLDRFNGDNNSDSSSNGEEYFLRNELRKCNVSGVIFDVGANVGRWSEYCLSVDPNLTIHLFEPSKATFKKLLEKKWPLSVKLNNCGLGEERGYLTLNIAEDGSAMNSIYKRRGVNGLEMEGSEVVVILTIDDYCQKNRIELIKLLKIDVEGHEFAVLKGAHRMLSEKRIEKIQFEYGGCYLDSNVLLSDVWRYLEDFDFIFYKIYPTELKLIKDYSQALENFKYSNWLAALRS